MSMVFDFIPYQQVGKLVFGMLRQEVKEIYGESTSSCMYGYPVEDRFLDDYDYMHTLCSNRELLEGVELFPDISPETLILKYDQVEILLTKEPGDLVDQLIKITDDLIKDEDEEGYSSKKLGLKIYCPDDIVENVILHDLHCYDEEEEFMEEQFMEEQSMEV